ncbi:asparagine--tRNA ligase [Philodulcilactobacillus myokoensis]|uniref:Asparagine--tRNA ligase n=1 Tax=Philodulcilactobacillus myokoensis TaxID=2929573 RepID=A0A9W6B1A5_9LACO|nr:asparagine--tRNA ligase [Philodulcilactobacillus myokoensis]GLB47102.1 asparagine--tRNA ligase [Philodulcilactobacillus myokoensis]
MQKPTVRDLYTRESYPEESIEMEGWVRTIRSSKKIAFIEMNDGTFLKNAQIIVKSANTPNFKDITKIPISATIKVTGKVIETPDAPQPFEIHADSLKEIGGSNSDYPLQKKAHSYEFLRKIAHLRPRTNTFYSVFKIRSLAAFAIHQYLQSKGFVYVNTPIITSSDTEGAGQMFRVTTMDMNNLPKTKDGKVDDSKDFFGQETNLTVSGQLPGEAYTLAFKDSYTFGPTFRAENSHTSRHASEFWMIEPDMAFANLQDIIDVQEGIVKYVIKYLFDHAEEELKFLDENVNHGLIKRLMHTKNEKFAVVTYTKAIKLLEDSGADFKAPVKWGIDLQSEHERYLSEQIFKKPVFVTDYPKGIKAFYMRDNEDGKTVAAVDMLMPTIGEMSGGSEREERYNELKKKIHDFNLPPEEYQWYLELRKYGETKHSGFGIGFERLLMYVTGMENIRDVIPFPREPGNAPF